ncbi:MAG: four helix bundle protein [Chitinophagaceae bacterium]|jgi:four helix bundle protein|nr:MAG: four helix bundle protein [Chitinophagaceae bacterium]
MATIRYFEDLEIWQAARELAKGVYKLYSSNDQFSKDFKLKGQINASSGSIMDNIAEGFGRSGNMEFVNFLSIAQGSLAETKSQLYRSFDRQYLSAEELDAMKSRCEELANKIGRLMNYLNQSDIKGNKYKDRVTKS